MAIEPGAPEQWDLSALFEITGVMIYLDESYSTFKLSYRVSTVGTSDAMSLQRNNPKYQPISYRLLAEEWERFAL